MGVAKRHKGVRITKIVHIRKNRKQAEGRPAGSFKRYPFEQTRLGFFLKYEVPIVYKLIMKQTPKGAFPAPDIKIIKTICAASKDPSLSKNKFPVYLKEYEKKGLYCHVGKLLTPKRKRFYAALEKKKLAAYIRANKKKIAAEKIRLGIK